LLGAVGKAHQRTIRERKQNDAAGENLFGSWWDAIDTDINKAIVREIDRPTCEKIILEYEWLGTMPAVVWYMFGIYWDGACGGVVCFGPEYGENLGVWDKYGMTGKIICLSRGACVHWAHPHAASKLIQASIKMLPKRFTAITATSDIRAGEIGTIYQACGWICCKMNTHTRSGSMLNGKRLNSRNLRQKFGNSRKETIHAIGATVEKEEAKIRYFFFRGSAKQRKQHIASISGIRCEYPKRNPSACKKDKQMGS